MKYKLILFDLDGTLYRGDQVIPNAPKFVETVRNSGCSCIFLTNNSSKTPQEVAEKLTHMDIQAADFEVYSSSLATAAYICDQIEPKRNKPTAYVIGEHGLFQALSDADIQITEQDPQYVIVGIDRQFNYDKLRTASQCVHDGAILIGTNPDRALPAEDHLLPGTGSLVQCVSVATGKEPIWIGKPTTRIIDYALKAYHQHTGTIIEKEQILMIGDNMETDIKAALEYGVDSALVLTGFTKSSEIAKYEQQPIYIAAALDELKKQL